MLRLLVVLLLVANGVFYVWSQGWLDGVTGSRARGEREPARLQEQLHPDAVKLLPPQAASAALAAAEVANAPVCLEAGPFAAPELDTAEQQLTALPAGSWVRIAAPQPGRWIVYMGRFADREALEQKIAEVKRRQVEFELVHDAPAYEPGLSLGSYDSRDAADAALEKLVGRGVHTARVLALVPPVSLTLLRVERADGGLRRQLATLAAGFAPCRSRQ
jgi:hypothetical protein